jgi:hypothetical protein
MSAPAENIEWYLAREGQQYGPVTETELRKIMELGHLRKEDLVWRDGFPEWREAGTVFPDEFEPKSPAPPVPTPSREPPQPTRQADLGGQNAQVGVGTTRFDDASRARDSEHVSQDWGEPANGPGGGMPAQGGRQQYGAGNAPTATAPAGDRFAPRDRRNIIDPPSVAARIEEAQQRERRVPDDVQWDNSDPHLAAKVASSKQMRRAPHAQDPEKSQLQAPAGYDDDFDDYGASVVHEPPYRSSVARALWSVLLAVVVGVAATVGWLFYTNSEVATRLYSQIISGNSSETVVIAAPSGSTRERVQAPESSTPADTAALTSPSSAETPSSFGAPETTASSPASGERTVASPLFATPMWAEFRSGFTDTAEQISQKAASMKSAGAEDPDISKAVLAAIVELRRNNAAAALQAPPENLKAIAQAFVSNLKFLRQASVEACYGFIAEGDMSASVLPLIADPSRSGPLHNQITAVFRAIEAGRASQARYGTPKREDFEVLSAELTNRGWGRDELQLFSDPRALSQAPHEKVCKLVTEWFETQLTLPDGDVKMRLLAASLNPVIAG